MGKQKTASAGAPKSLNKKSDIACWNSVDWTAERRQVRRLQMRIAKATQQGRWNKVKSLQYLLTRSRAAKLLAVKRVTTNKGNKVKVKGSNLLLALDKIK